MDGRKIEHVKAHAADVGQPTDHITKGPVPAWIGGDRTGEQFVPAGKFRQRALHLQWIGLTEYLVRADTRFAHECKGFRGEKKTQPLVQCVGFIHLRNQAVKHLRMLGRSGLLRLANELLALLQLQGNGYSGTVFLLHLVIKAGVEIAPGFNDEQVSSRLFRTDRRFPAVVAEKRHRHGMQAVFIQATPAQIDSQLVMAIGKDHGTD